MSNPIYIVIQMPVTLCNMYANNYNDMMINSGGSSKGVFRPSGPTPWPPPFSMARCPRRFQNPGSVIAKCILNFYSDVPGKDQR